MPIFHYILPFLAFILSFSAICVVFRLPSDFIALDKPNVRSLHNKPIPRVGGIALLIGIILPLLLYGYTQTIGSTYLHFFWALIIVAGISLLDDFYSISFLIRIMVHIIAAVIVVHSGYFTESSTMTWINISLPVHITAFLLIFFIVWMINLYNFMDGIDGLAGGMAVFGFGTFAVIGFIEGQSDFAVTSIVIASSSFGFLVWNYPPARIFMGDSGSASLGFLVAVLSIWAHVDELIPIWISLVIFSPFVIDATATLITRILKRERFWDAHKSHHYQLAAESGMDRKRLVNYEYILMFVCSVLAITSYNASSGMQVLLIFGLTIIYIILMRYTRGLSINNQCNMIDK